MHLLSILAATTNSTEGQINSFSIKTVLVSSLILVVLLLISSKVIQNKKNKQFKKPLFILIALTIIVPSLLMTGSTIYLNTISDSKGPVHWHADIEFWVCGQEIELRDPYQFLSNKVGTSTYHEHDDKRIHLEGVVIDTAIDASLGKFMEVTGGSIGDDKLVIPTNETQIFEDDVDGDQVYGDKTLVETFVNKAGENEMTVEAKNGDGCSEQGYGEVQAFLYRLDETKNTYTQTKLQHPAEYILRDEATVPPGDCVIVEFDLVKATTDKLCQQYGVRDSLRCVEFGVSKFNPDLCNLEEVKNNNSSNVNDGIIEPEEL